MVVNIYSLVWVKLTETGEKTYERFLRKIKLIPCPAEKDENGFSMFDLRSLMRIFGEKCCLRGEEQFVDERVYFSKPATENGNEEGTRKIKAKTIATNVVGAIARGDFGDEAKELIFGLDSKSDKLGGVMLIIALTEAISEQMKNL